MLGVAHTTVGRWLNGTSRPYDRILHKLSQTFDISIDILKDDALELPARFTDGRHEIVLRAGKAATDLFPDNNEAGQAFFEARLEGESLKVDALEIAEQLRRKADELTKMADLIEQKFKLRN